MSNPLVSIVTCTYNRAEMLKEAMSSILEQQYEPVERLVIDDGSSDNTNEVIAAYGDRIRYYRHDNKGLVATMNVACQQFARGEYIAFQDDDDLMPPDRITWLYEAMCRYPQAVLAVGEAEMIDAKGNRTGERITLQIKGKNNEPVLIEDGYKAILWPLITPATGATLFRKADGERIGWFDERFPRCCDTDFFARLGQLGPIVYVPRVVSYYRRGHTSRWSNNVVNSLLCEYGNLMLFEKHLRSIRSEQKEIRKRLQNRLFHTLRGLAFLARDRDKMPEMISEGHVKKGIALLGIKERLAYKWYVNIKLPVRKVIKG